MNAVGAVAAILVKDNIDKKQNLQAKTKNIAKKANKSTNQEVTPLLEQEINSINDITPATNVKNKCCSLCIII